jgi:excisionase family DNA binding protein
MIIIKEGRNEMQNYENEVIGKLSSIEDILKRNDKKLLSFKELCDYLGFSPSCLYKLTRKKMIPSHKPLGKKIFFFKNEIDSWIAANANNEKLWDDNN